MYDEISIFDAAMRQQKNEKTDQQADSVCDIIST